jgi:hypothetical protein
MFQFFAKGEESMKAKTFLTLGLLVLLLTACATPTPAPTATPLPPTATPVPPTETPAPTATPTETPQPVGGGPVTSASITNFKVEQQGSAIVISFDFSGHTSDYNAFHIFVDSDNSAATGYKVDDIGAEFMLENASLFSYGGDGDSWAWNQVSPADVGFNPAEPTVSWTVERAALKLDKATAAAFVAQLVNTNWDTVATTPKLAVEFK